jgi:hypothetical protein
MNMIKFCLPLLASAILLLPSCSDIFLEDLEGQSITVLYPQANTSLSAEQVTFRWEALDGAEEYRLRIVKPNFTQIQAYVLDSLTEQLSMRVSLDTGRYAWILEARNSGSFTRSDTFNLWIQADTNLSATVLELIAPLNNTVLLDDSVALVWQEVNFADVYRVQVAVDPSFNALFLVQNQLVTLEYLILGSSQVNDGSYYWRVRAENAFAQSSWSSTRRFNVDLIPSLSLPNSNASITLPFAFTWNADPGALRDSFYLRRGSPTGPLHLSAASANQSLLMPDTLTPGIYYWQLRSVHQLLNGTGTEPSSYSESRKVNVL